MVKEAGYEVESAAREQRPPRSPEAEVREFRNRFLVALILSLPVWACMIPPVEPSPGSGPPGHEPHPAGLLHPGDVLFRGLLLYRSL